MSQAEKRIKTQAGPQAALLAEGRRLHLQHGPIDLIIEAFGDAAKVKRAYAQAHAAFQTILGDLVVELSLLRKPVGAEPEGQIARAMWAATKPYAPEFITPMAAVAGSVADHILKALKQGTSLDRAYVNNGGDIALLINEGTFKIGICENPATGEKGATVELGPNDGIGGIATSGWRGRSFSLGIADAVTVLAETAARADTAATMIANYVDLPGSSKIMREPAHDLSPDSDLGSSPVTTSVAELTDDEVSGALSSGAAKAREYHQRGLFRAAYLALSHQRLIVPEQFETNNFLEKTPHVTA